MNNNSNIQQKREYLKQISQPLAELKKSGSIESINEFGNLECGITLNKPEILFNRIDINE